MLPKQRDILETLCSLAENVEPIRSAKIAAAIVDRRGNIISVGINQRKTHPLQAKFSKNELAIFLHAEVDAIKNVKSSRDLSDCTLVVARVKRPESFSKKWVPALAKPCPGCEQAMRAFGISRVVYTTDDNPVFEEYGWNRNEDMVNT